MPSHWRGGVEKSSTLLEGEIDTLTGTIYGGLGWKGNSTERKCRASILVSCATALKWHHHRCKVILHVGCRPLGSHTMPPVVLVSLESPTNIMWLWWSQFYWILGSSTRRVKMQKSALLDKTGWWMDLQEFFPTHPSYCYILLPGLPHDNRLSVIRINAAGGGSRKGIPVKC